MSWKRPNIGSRMSREVHVRFWERLEVKFLRATRHPKFHRCLSRSSTIAASWALRSMGQWESPLPVYLITLHAAWRATGDRGLLERHLETAEGCLAWIEKYGDRDGDGFQEYQTRSPVGYENMAWKDSGDAVMYPDGSLVQGPKALCELQGYVYNAWVRM